MLADPSTPAQPAAATRKTAEELALRMESEIMERGWPVGTVLGSERDLIERHRVGRAVLREAVRILEHHGAATMRRGPGGGLIVTAPDVNAVKWPAALYLDYVNVTTGNLVSARTALELSAIELAIERLDADGIAALNSTLALEEKAGSGGFAVGFTHELHREIARLSGNQVHMLFIEALVDLTVVGSGGATWMRRQMADSHRAHAAIVEAIIARDVPMAQRRMRRHLEAALATYREQPRGR